MMETRIYLVKTEIGDRLVRASNKAQAVSFVVRSSIKAELAGQDDLVRLLSEGVAVEDSAADPDPEPT